MSPEDRCNFDRREETIGIINKSTEYLKTKHSLQNGVSKKTLIAGILRYEPILRNIVCNEIMSRCEIVSVTYDYTIVLDATRRKGGYINV